LIPFIRLSAWARRSESGIALWLLRHPTKHWACTRRDVIGLRWPEAPLSNRFLRLWMVLVYTPDVLAHLFCSRTLTLPILSSACWGSFRSWCKSTCVEVSDLIGWLGEYSALGEVPVYGYRRSLLYYQSKVMSMHIRGIHH